MIALHFVDALLHVLVLLAALGCIVCGVMGPKDNPHTDPESRAGYRFGYTVGGVAFGVVFLVIVFAVHW